MSNRPWFALVATAVLLAAAVPLASSQGVGPAIVLSRASASLTEGGSSVSYTVALSTPSPSAVVVTIGGGSGDLGLTPASLTFPPGSTAAQTVVLRATDDAATEGTESFTLTHTSASDDPSYAGRSAALVAGITDNDLGVVLLHGGADASGTTVGESGAQDTVRVALGAAPTATVTVRLTPDPQLSLATLTLAFTPSDWKAVRQVAIAAADDQVAQGARTKLVTAAATSSQAAYHGRSASLQASIVDNDVAGYLFTSPGQTGLPANTLPALAFAEGGESSFTLRLTSQPVAPVTVHLGGTAGASPVPSSLTFTATSWSAPQQVRVLRPQDSIDQGNAYPATVPLSTATSDASYATIPGPIQATIADDDTAGLVLSHTGADTSVREGGPGDTFLVRLATQPQAGVTVGLSAPAGLALDPSSVAFDASSWSTPRAVSVSAVDDAAAGLPRSVEVTAATASTDAAYQGLAGTLPVQLADDDGVLLIVESAGATRVAEGGAADSFTVRLVGAPTAPVTVTLTGSDASQFRVNGGPSATLTFDPRTASVAAPCSSAPTKTCPWDAPQVVTVEAVPDHRVDGLATGTISLRTASGDAAFDGQVSRPVGVTAIDTDVAGLAFDGQAVAVTEGGSASFTVRLGTVPSGGVTVSLAGSGGTVAAPASLTFDATSWNTPRTVTVTVPRDQVDQGSGYGAAVGVTVTASADPHYSGKAASVPVAVTDHAEDIAGWLFSAAGQTGLARDALPALAFAEGGSVPYTVRLASKPTSDVVLSVSGSAGSVATPASLTFTPSTWATPRTVTVAVPQDSIDQGTAFAADVLQSAASADSLYRSVPSPLRVDVTDDDAAGLRWIASGASTLVQEAGVTDTVQVVLTSQPAAPVSLALTVSQDIGLAPTSVAFTPSDWNSPRTIQLVATDDASPELTETHNLHGTAASSDALYAGRSLSTAVRVLDNDGVLVVRPTGPGTTVEEGGEADTYTVQLTANPSHDVHVTVSSGEGGLHVNGAATRVLTFRPSSNDALGSSCPGEPTVNCVWNKPQTVTVSYADNGDVRGAHAALVQHAVASEDPRFDRVPSSGLEVLILDDDPGFLLVHSDGATSVREGGAADTYSIALSTAPGFSVAVVLDVPDGLSAGPTTLFFDAASWDIPQTVTVAAFEDPAQGGARVLSIVHRASSAEEAYNGRSFDLAVAVQDGATAS